jgi:hypothetical protein
VGFYRGRERGILEKYTSQLPKHLKDRVSAKALPVSRYRNIVRVEDVMSHYPITNTKHIIQDLHNIPKSYYQVILKCIVDVIYMQATKHHLLSRPFSPLKLFSLAFIKAMSLEQLEDIAGKDAR